MKPTWILLHPRATYAMLGYIPEWLDENDPDTASQQLHKHYAHGGGWQPYDGFKMRKPDYALTYPGDPPTIALAMCNLRSEVVVMYQHAWVAVIQPNGSFEVSRMA